MDLPFLQKQIVKLQNDSDMFQSLFLWIFRSYRKAISNVISASDVSILVLMDLPFLHYFYECLYKKRTGFQSLFLWIFRSYEVKEVPSGIDYKSFNPCSYGSSVLTHESFLQQFFRKFVSILVLMDLPFLL